MMHFTPQPYFYRQPSLRSRSMFEPEGDDFYSSPYTRPNPYAYRPSYEELQEARAREYHRRRQAAEFEAARQAELARRAAISERYHRQHLEQQRERERQQKLRYLAELDRKKYLEALLRSQRLGGYEGRHWYDDASEDDEENMIHYPVRETASPSVPLSAPAASAAPSAAAASPKPTRAEPTLERQNEAASLIQSFYRATLARRKALATLSSIRSSFNNLTSSFTFPSAPSFDQVPSTATADAESTPVYKFSYNSTNAPIHAFEDALVRLLSKIDGVESNGDLRVRKQRKKLARNVERALEELDRKKEDAIEAYRRAKEVVQPEVQVEEAESSESSLPAPVSVEDVQAEVQVEEAESSQSSLPASVPVEDVHLGSESAAVEKEDAPNSLHLDNPEEAEMQVEVTEPESDSQASSSPHPALSESTPTPSAPPSAVSSEIHIEDTHPHSSSSPLPAHAESTPPSPTLSSVSPQPDVELPQPMSEDPHPSLNQSEPEVEVEADWAFITPEVLNNSASSDDGNEPEPDLRSLFDLQDSEMELEMA